MPEWVIKMIKIDDTRVLCGLRKGIVAVVDLKKGVTISSLRVSDQGINDMCSLTYD